MPDKIIPPERLARYRQHADDTREDIIARYAWNIALSEALYPTLSILEVTLRNQMDEAFVKHLYPGWLEPSSPFWRSRTSQEYRKLIETRSFLPLTANRGHLIAELTFGFWVGLFKNDYKPLIWNKPRVFDAVFPTADLKTLDRVSSIRPKLRIARILRNRISHHEAIFDMPRLRQTVQDIQQVINWLSPEATQLLRLLNRFQEVHRTGWQAYKAE